MNRAAAKAPAIVRVAPKAAAAAKALDKAPKPFAPIAVVHKTVKPAAKPVTQVAAAKAQKPVDFVVVENEPMRVWRDDTGMFEIHGRLILMMPGKVRILKDTGRTTTVPLNRLSRSDLAYVQQHGSSMLAKLAADAPQR
jgi:hypothetical protein